MPFFVIFIVIPLLELWVFLTVSRFIGLGTTLLMCFLTALIGGSMVRAQGLNALRSAQAEMMTGGVPSREMFDGLCIVAAGALLLTPGFITDFLGVLLLLPPVRAILRKRLERSATFRAAHFSQEYRGPYTRSPANDPSIIEGEYERLDERENRKNSGSK